MKIDFECDYEKAGSIFMEKIASPIEEDSKKAIDTFTFLREIKRGYSYNTFCDKPYIVPFLSNETKKAVIVVSGGAYAYKTMDGEVGEGEKIAKILNDNGYSAFLLWYRSNPYRYPVPVLDLQRAIRYIKYKSKEFRIDPDDINIIGFSAGGNLCASFINIHRGKAFFPQKYEPDEIDKQSDSVATCALIYPAVTYEFNPAMLYASFDKKEVDNLKKREELIKELNLTNHYSSSDIPQFVSYGDKDNLVNNEETKKYIKKALDCGTKITVKEAKNQQHGFDCKYFIDDYLQFLKNN